jgi:hypothetical protein
LRQRGVEDRNLIGGVASVGPPGTQHRRQRLPGTAATVIDERHHRVKPVSTLEVRGGAFFVRVRPDQGGIQIDHHLPSGGNRRGQLPHHRPRGGPRPPDRGDRRAGILTESVNEPADRGIRGDQAEQRRLSTQQRHIGQTVTAQRDRHRQIQRRLTRIVDRPRRPPRPQLLRHLLHQAADLRSLQ